MKKVLNYFISQKWRDQAREEVLKSVKEHILPGTDRATFNFAFNQGWKYCIDTLKIQDFIEVGYSGNYNQECGKDGES